MADCARHTKGELAVAGRCRLPTKTEARGGRRGRAQPARAPRRRLRQRVAAVRNAPTRPTPAMHSSKVCSASCGASMALRICRRLTVDEPRLPAAAPRNKPAAAAARHGDAVEDYDHAATPPPPPAPHVQPHNPRPGRSNAQTLPDAADYAHRRFRGTRARRRRPAGGFDALPIKPRLNALQPSASHTMSQNS